MNKRLRQVEIMFSQITKLPKGESRTIILKTKTGKMIMEQNSTVLYEQQTENLYNIGNELNEILEYKRLARYFTIKAIVDANKFLANNPSILREAQMADLSSIPSAPTLKSIQRARLKKQNQILNNIQKRGEIQAKWRANYANNTEK